MFDPLASAKRLDNGSLYVEVSPAELGPELNEDVVRKAFDRLNDQSTIDFGEDEEAEMRVAMFTEIDQQSLFNTEALNDIVSKELDIFQPGEEYDFVKDLRTGYDDGLRETAAQKMFKTIPDHVFWDIKTPLRKDLDSYANPYNPARKNPYDSFFDMRKHEAYHRNQKEKRNINDNVSFYQRY